MSRFVVAIFLLFCAVAGAQNPVAPAERLADLVNGYRVAQGLVAIPISPSLTAVAQAHVQDLEQARHAGQCNGHSWSAAGPWSACCYTADHAQAQCMWDKPGEITFGAYPGPGFEIVFWASGQATAAKALERWAGSAGHRDVILSRGVWSHSHWQAMGVAVSAHHAVVWFGELPDALADR